MNKCANHHHKSVIALILIIILGIIISIQSPKLITGQSTGSLAISANVNANCVFRGTGGTLNFGTYDPLDVNASLPLDVTGSFDIRCTKGVTAQLGIGLGLHASGTIRRMAGGTDFLTYEIYKEAGRTNVWGSAGTERVPYTATNNQFYTESVFGRVPGGQDISAGDYSDTATLTADF